MKRSKFSFLNNQDKHFILCVILCLTLCFSGRAQTPHWLLSTHYQSIQPYSSELFKVRENGFVGIVDNNGTVVLSSVADSITNFTNGYALVLKKEEDRYRILSILSSQRKITQLSEPETLYTGAFSFFSENKCAVTNKKGKYGYIDTSGRLTIPCKYLSARPFNEGLASVCKGKGGFKGLVNSVVDKMGGNADAIGQSLYINEDGKPLKLANEIGTPTLASTFSGGKAFVMNDKGAYIIDNTGQIVSIEHGDHLTFDDYFILTSMTEPRSANEPYLATRDVNDYLIYERNGLKGLMRGSLVILPAQFNDLDYLWQGRAIVKQKDMYGLICLSGSVLNCDVDEKNSTLTATATLPSEYNGKAVSLSRIDGDESISYMMAGNDATRTLEVKLPNNIPQDDPYYELLVDNLVLWRSSEAATTSRASSDEGTYTKSKKGSKQTPVATRGIAVSCPASVKANSKNVCSVPVTVTNKGNTALNVKITASTGTSVSITVPAGKSKTATLSIADVKKSKKCTITASSSAGSKSCKTVLNPYFAL